VKGAVIRGATLSPVVVRRFLVIQQVGDPSDYERHYISVGVGPFEEARTLHLDGYRLEGGEHRSQVGVTPAR
jgi:hypothetical protein